MSTEMDRFRTPLYTGFALVAFAANSLLCRLALGESAIDAASFTTIRLASGAATLSVIAAGLGARAPSKPAGNWISAALLFLYAATFSFAYVSLSAGTGALILFGAVQATMILAAMGSGERLHSLEWAGLALALLGLVVLVLPGLKAPSPEGCALMAIAGIAWGVYSLRGRGEANPLASTTANFVRSSPLAVAVSVVALRSMNISGKGACLAVLSGALTSGVGYVVWYAALRGLTATQAATVQLSVPVLAAAGGVIFLSERVSLRLALPAIMILGGVGVAVSGRRKPGRAG